MKDKIDKIGILYFQLWARGKSLEIQCGIDISIIIPIIQEFPHTIYNEKKKALKAPYDLSQT